jgi:SAM-dependent methyltransferase
LGLVGVLDLMSRIPPRWKRLLLPIWNGGHRLAWRVGEYAGAVWHRRFERCAVCGRFGPMLYRRRVIPPRLEQLWGLSPRLAEALARKESCECAWCGSKLRVRRLALVLLRTFPVGDPPALAPSVAEWVLAPAIRSLRVAEVNTIEGLHDRLLRLPALAWSDYQPGAAPGAVAGGVRSEDLTRLTYPDSAFDLVLTSETLEHVPDLAAALGEIHRVLARGGRHIFTVPLLPGVARTFARMVVRPDATLDHLFPLICHPGGDVGYPVFTEFGADWPDLLRGAGFEVSVEFGPVTEDDLAQVYVGRKIERGNGPTP